MSEVLSIHCELLSDGPSDQSMRRAHSSCVEKQQRMVCRLQRRETVTSIFRLEDLSSDAIITLHNAIITLHNTIITLHNTVITLRNSDV